MTRLSPHCKIVSSGKFIDFDQPHLAPIDRATIANELSLINRWNGNLHFAYSVAQHSLLVADLMPKPEWRIYGLLHDAAEAYIGDLPTPFKKWLQAQGTDILGLEGTILACVWRHFDLPAPSQEITLAVYGADQIALATEYRDVVKGTSDLYTPRYPPHSTTIKFLERMYAEHRFLDSLDPFLSIWDAAQEQIKGAA